MSRFIDKLNQLSRTESQPIGFMTAQPASPKPKMQLVASLAQENVDQLADCGAGADAVLLRISKPGPGAKTLQKISQAVPDIPWGGWLPGGGQGKIKQITRVGGDFVVFPATNTPLAILQDDEVGKILEIEVSLGEGFVRAANELPIDAVLIAGEQKEDYFLTWQHLILFRRFADLLTKLLLVSVAANVTANELQALWEVGVDGVMVDIVVGQPVGKLKELRRMIDSLALPSKRKRVKREALLPSIRGEASTLIEEEEEEEEEEE